MLRVYDDSRHYVWYLEEYRGKFDAGWDAEREAVFAKQLESGIFPKGGGG